MRLPVLLASLSLLCACGGGGGASAPAPPPTPPATTCPIPVAKASPSFSLDIVPALQSSCGSATTTCHGGGASPNGHLNYSGSAAQIRAELVNVTPANAPAGWVLVKPGDPTHSWIIEKVTKDQPGGSGYGTRMPQAAPNLCQPTIDTLSAWISAGAPSN